MGRTPTTAAVIPPADAAEQPVSRKPGQDFGNPSHQEIILIHRVGHKADSDSFTRSKKKTYLRKVAAQKKKKGKQA